MKRIRILLIALILVLGICICNIAYAETRNIGAQEKRPFTDKEYKYQVQGLTQGNPLYYTIVKLYDNLDRNDSNELLYNKALYCLRGGVGFGANDEQDVSNAPIEYTEFGEMHTNARAIIEKYNELYSVNLDRTETIDEKQVNIYNAILWILDEAYLPKNATNYNEAEYKSDLLAKAGIYDPNNEVSKDDIEVIQQLAIWYFANYDQQLEKIADPTIITPSRATKFPAQFLSVDGNNDLANYRKLDKLFQYFINGALEYSSNYTVNADGARTKVIEKNEFNKEDSKLTMESVDKGYKRPGVYVLTDYYYVIGPFSFIEGNENAKVDPNDIVLYDKNGNTIKKVYYTYETINEEKVATGKDTVYAFYNESKATIENGKVTALTGEPDTEITKGTEYYIKFYKIYDKDFTTGDDEADEKFDYISADEKYDISKISLKVLSSYSLSTATVLTRTNQDQVLVEINKQKVQDEDELTVEKPKYFDLSLRKFIASINGVSPVTSRVPKINTNSLINGRLNWKGTREYTATYSHPKDALPVEKGNKVIYTLRIYNEGDIAGTATEVTDYIPSGLQFVQGSEINTRYGWTVSEDGRKATTNYLANTTIKAFEVGKTTIEAGWQKAETGLGGLYYADLQIECEVIANPTDANPDLRNIAAITQDNGDDRDSNRDGNEPNINDYNPTEDNSTYQEDDDDYEPLKLKTPVFDLALRKYITKVETADGTVKTIANPRDLNNIDTNRLNSTDSATGEKITTADYMHRKDPVVVEPEDIVTYTFRAYNEGDIEGNVTSITDYLPKGLKLDTTGLTKVESEDANIEIWTKSDNIPTDAMTGLFTDVIYTFNKTARTLTIKYETNGEPSNMFGLDPFNASHADESSSSTVTRKEGWIKGLNYGETSVKLIVDPEEVEVTSKDMILTNVATMEYASVGETRLPDRDSNRGGEDHLQVEFNVPEQSKLVSSDETAYKGLDSNPDNLTSEIHFKGQQDDDDFEKIIIRGKNFDLALRKYIDSVNGEKESPSREPQIDTSKLNTIDAATGKKITTATYKHTKDPITVKKGDIVTYKIRIYNEGDRNGYATKVTDYLPDGLGFLYTSDGTINSNWFIPQNIETNKLYGENGIYSSENEILKKDAYKKVFGDNVDLSKIEVIQAKKKSDDTRDLLEITAGGTVNQTNIKATGLIKAYGSQKETGDLWQQSTNNEQDGLFYQELEITCVVLKENTYLGTLKNVAEITAAEDSEGNEIKLPGDDRDSEPGNVYEDSKHTPGTEVSGYTPGEQDDDDFEPLVLKCFDLALRKFITNIESAGTSTDVTSRIPVPKMNAEGKITYEHTKEPLYVANTDIVTYTIRVFNEGTVAGYAEEITDDLPEGLIFLPNNEINKQYEWKMIDKDGKETQNVDEAVKVVTDYLSSGKETENRKNIINPFDASTGITEQNPDYKDVKIAFRVIEPNTSDRILVNSAQISKDSDDDIDSVPGKWTEGEDDQDREYIKVRYFDLSLLKWVTQTIVTVDGKTKTTETGFKPNTGKTETTGIRDNSAAEPIAKVELDKKKLNKTVVKFAYKIRVTNEGELEGYATEITDRIPEGLEFYSEDNTAFGWEQKGDGLVTTRALETTLLKPGEFAEVTIIFRWKNDANNLGLKTNVAHITEDYNKYNSKDIDSTPNNLVNPYEKEQEDDDDFALVMLSLMTGKTAQYTLFITSMIMLLATGLYLIKKKVLDY